MKFRGPTTPTRWRVWGVALCLAAGCQTPSHRSGAPPPVAAVVSDAPLELAPDAAQRAEALAYFATGAAVQMTQGLEPAIEYYRRAAELDPTNLEQGLNLAKLHLSRQEATLAIDLLERLTVATPTAGEPWFWLGIAYRAGNRPAESLTALQRAHKLDPDDINPIQALLEAHLQQPDHNEAVKLLERAWRRRSTSADYWLRLGDFYRAAVQQAPALGDRLDAARPQDCYEQALALAPDNPEIIARLAPLYEASEQPDRALALYQRLSAAKPGDVALHIKLAESYLQVDNKAAAAAELEKVIAIDPLRFVHIYNELAGIYEELEQDERAITTYEQSLAVNPRQPEPYLRSALIHLRHKRLELAQRSLDCARERFPTASQVAYLQGLLHNERNDYAKAIVAFADAETLAGEAPAPGRLDATFFFYYGSASERAGNIDKAAELFRRCLELNPNHHAAQNYLGYMWAEKGIHLEEAHALIIQAVAAEPNNGAYLDSLGWVLHQLGRHQEALPHLLRAVELAEQDAILHHHLADVFRALGRTQEAIAQLELAHKLDPDDATISEKLENLKASNSAAEAPKPTAP